MSGDSKKITAFNYLGSKFTHLNSLYPYFPGDFVHLVDLFAGSLAVTLNYHGKVIKTANEINGEITNFFYVLREQPVELIEKLRLTPISEKEFSESWKMTGDSIEDARRFYVRVRQSFWGLGSQAKNKGWHMAKTQINCNSGESVSRFVNGVESLWNIAERIRQVFQILNDDFEKAIDRIDFIKAFFYCDPPYPEDCRASKNDYRFEFTDDDHKRLADKLHSIKGMAMISSYESKLISSLYKDWTMVPLPIKKNNLRKSKVQECIWFNYPLEQCAKHKHDLFKTAI